MTNTSLTAMQAIVSTPFALSASKLWMLPCRCFASHVGLNAPGTENSTTFLPLKSWSVVTSWIPSLVFVLNVPAGILSPALIAISSSPSVNSVLARRRARLQIVREALVAGHLHGVERRVAAIVLHIEAGAASHEEFRGLLAMPGDGEMQCGVAALALLVDGNTAIEQQAADARHARERGVVQDAVAGAVMHLDVGAALDERL